ncbi:MAG: hypothetical protein P4L55_01565, partial [Syntrophobacteraceae bacterium]|nr:hypothetical protein [Syntrophobacteraceae bacterium]
LACTSLGEKLDSLTRQENELETALMPVRLNLARLACLTGLSGPKADELASELAKVLAKKKAVLNVMEAKGCR